jgi:DNA-binding transcriptional ArsR family regulator
MQENAEFKKVQPFLEDILILHGVSKNMSQLIFEMFPYINPEGNIIINAFLKKELALKTKMSKGTIDNTLSKLNEVGLLIRLDRGTYELHPVIYESKKLLRDETATMKISYNKQQRKIETD